LRLRVPVFAMLVLFHVVGVAVTPLKVTVPDVPKLVPVMVTDIPTPAGFGEMAVMLGVL